MFKPFEIFLYYIKCSDGQLFYIFFIALFFYLFAKVLYEILNWLFFKIKPFKNFKSFLRGLIFICITFLILLFCLGFVFIQITTHVDPQKIVFSNNAAMQVDNFLFGKYIPFWFQDIKNPLKPFFDFSASFIIGGYMALGFFISAVFIFLFIKKPDYFLKMLLAFFIAVFVSVPSWVLFPVIVPHHAYLDNILKAPIPNSIQTALSTYAPNKDLEKFFEFTDVPESFYKSDNKFFGITGMPSMHIAWSVLILYFGIMLWRPLSIVLIPYFILNAVSTMYTLQHYTIDIFGGIIAGALSIWLAHVITKNRTPKVLTEMTQYVQKDLKDLFSFFILLIKDIKSSFRPKKYN